MVTPTTVEGALIATLSKAATLKMLREWRKTATSGDEADVLTDAIEVIERGELDG